MLAAQFDFELVRELPQEGDGLAEIRQCTVHHAGFRLGAQRDLDAEALERLVVYLVAADNCDRSIYHTL